MCNVPVAVTKALRRQGIDVLTAQKDGAAELDDAVLLMRATALGRILVTQDKDLLREGNRMLLKLEHFSGIVYGHRLSVSIGRWSRT